MQYLIQKIVRALITASFLMRNPVFCLIALNTQRGNNMLQHLADHVDITAGCVVCVLELDHIGQFLVRGYTDNLFSGALCSFHGTDLILINTPEYIAGIGYL